MSNPVAIATVTGALSRIFASIPHVDPVLSDLIVTVKAPDRAREQDAGPNQLNLFLYQTMANVAWRNLDAAQKSRQRESGRPPLALNLFYFITAFGLDGDDLLAHRVLGQAMRLLHDHPVLTSDEIQQAIVAQKNQQSHTDALQGSDLDRQVERLHIVYQQMSTEELTKLWTMFQTKYRISAAYQISVVLIGSNAPSRTPLPVLTRGALDRGAIVQSSLLPPYPSLTEIRLPFGQPSARLGTPAGVAGDEVVLCGHHLDGDNASVHLSHPLLSAAVALTTGLAQTDSDLRFALPAGQAELPAGLYAVSVSQRDPRYPEQRHTTNSLALAVAPRILGVDKNPVDRAAGSIVQVRCSPQVWLKQRASLLVSDREVLAEPRTEATDTLLFELRSLPTGLHRVRLRVDGVDSLIIDYSAAPPAFDAQQLPLEIK